MFAALSSSLPSLAGQLPANNSYQCLLLCPHPLLSLAVQLPANNSYQWLLLSPHPCTLWQSSFLLTTPTSVCCSLLILAFSGSAVFYSLLLPVFAALSSCLALSGSAAFSHSSYQCLLLSPHALHSLVVQLSLTPPTSVGCSPLMPCTL